MKTSPQFLKMSTLLECWKFWRSEDIYHQKKDLEKRSDIDVEISTDFTITLKTWASTSGQKILLSIIS